MTKEMATSLIKQYSHIMYLADKAWDEGNKEGYDKWLEHSFLLERVVADVGFSFRKTWDGQYVIVER